MKHVRYDGSAPIIPTPYKSSVSALNSTLRNNSRLSGFWNRFVGIVLLSRHYPILSLSQGILLDVNSSFVPGISFICLLGLFSLCSSSPDTLAICIFFNRFLIVTFYSPAQLVSKRFCPQRPSGQTSRGYRWCLSLLCTCLPFFRAQGSAFPTFHLYCARRFIFHLTPSRFPLVNFLRQEKNVPTSTSSLVHSGGFEPASLTVI